MTDDVRDGEAELNFVMQARRDKLDALGARGVAPFAYGFERSHFAAAAVALLPPAGAPEPAEGPSVRVAGRITAWRAHGKTTFAHLADPTGRIQLYFEVANMLKEPLTALRAMAAGAIG